MLMIKVLSNNEILSYLYDRIFQKQKMMYHHKAVRRESIVQPKPKLPKLNFNLSYHHTNSN